MRFIVALVLATVVISTPVKTEDKKTSKTKKVEFSTNFQTDMHMRIAAKRTEAVNLVKELDKEGATPSADDIVLAYFDMLTQGAQSNYRDNLSFQDIVRRVRRAERNIVKETIASRLLLSLKPGAVVDEEFAKKILMQVLA
jgi:hypothetical protein